MNILPYIFALALAFGPVQAKDDYDLAYYGNHDSIKIKRSTFTVDIVLYDSQEELQLAWESMPNREQRGPGKIQAFALVNPERTTCYIAIVPATNWDQRDKMAMLGHEMYHCMGANHGSPIAIPLDDKL